MIDRRTVGRHLTRLGLGKRRFIDPGGENNRKPGKITARWPGHMVHLDVKKVGRIPDGGGWRIHGRASDQAKVANRAKSAGAKRGYVYLHSVVDGFSRLAYTEPLGDEKGATAAAFLARAKLWFAAHGINHIHRVVTDNGACYRSGDFARIVGQGTRHQRTKPYTPQHNGKVERYQRIMAEEVLYAREFTSEDARSAAIAVWNIHYNYHRPHSAAAGKPPAARLRASVTNVSPHTPTDPHEMERIVVGLAAAAFKNARDMLTSAQAVLDAQIWPTAFSMAALALEEVGKAVLCMTMLGKSPEARDEFRPQFHKAFTDHKTKAVCAHLVLAVVAEEVPATLEQMLDEVIQSAHETNAVKFRGLYVDYTDTGALLMPDVDEARARWMVSTVTTALAESRPAEEAVADPDAYLAFLRQWQGSVDFEALEAYIEAAPEEFMADVRALVRDDVPPPTIFLGSALAQQITTVDGLHVAAGEEAPPVEA